jgi:sec-independent protein translocase protein TatA
MGPVGVQEMIVIFLVALVLFGPKKLPELGKTIGKALTEFRKAQSELKSTFETHMRELERESESVKEVTRSFSSDVYPTEARNNYEQYDSPYYDSGAYGSEPYTSTEASPSTTGASAIQGAETTVSHETPTVHQIAAPAQEHHPVLHPEAPASTPVESGHHANG